MFTNATTFSEHLVRVQKLLHSKRYNSLGQAACNAPGNLGAGVCLASMGEQVDSSNELTDNRNIQTLSFYCKRPPCDNCRLSGPYAVGYSLSNEKKLNRLCCIAVFERIASSVLVSLT